MSNDPNKLAWKGTPGPWIVEKNTVCYEIRQHPKGKHDLCLLVAMGGMHDNAHADRNKANAYMISAAPEAIEFIADFLEVMDNMAGVTPELASLIDRGEVILKKAYNH